MFSCFCFLTIYRSYELYKRNFQIFAKNCVVLLTTKYKIWLWNCGQIQWIQTFSSSLFVWQSLVGVKSFKWLPEIVFLSIHDSDYALPVRLRLSRVYETKKSSLWHFYHVIVWLAELFSLWIRKNRCDPDEMWVYKAWEHTCMFAYAIKICILSLESK